MARITSFTKITITCLVILSLSAKVICDDLPLELSTTNQEGVGLEDTTSGATSESSITAEDTKEFSTGDLTSIRSQVEAIVPSFELGNESDSFINLNQSKRQSNIHTSSQEVTNSDLIKSEPTEENLPEWNPASNSPQLPIGIQENTHIHERSDILLKDTEDISIPTDTPELPSINVDPTVIPDSGILSGESDLEPLKNQEVFEQIYVPTPLGLSETPDATSENTYNSSSLIPEIIPGENQSDTIQDGIDNSPDTDPGRVENAESSIAYTDENEVPTVTVEEPNNKTPPEQLPSINYTDSQEEIGTQYIAETESPKTVEENPETTDFGESEIIPEVTSPTNLSSIDIGRKSQTESKININNSESSVNVTRNDAVGSIGRRIGDSINLETLPDSKGNKRPGKGLPMPRTPNNSRIENLVEEMNNRKTVKSENMTRAAKLKAWLQDPYLRAPVALLVPLKPKALNRALGVWRELVNTSVSLSDMILIGYDDNGIGWLSRHSLQRGSNIAGSSSGANSVTASLAKLLQKQMNRPTPLLTPAEGVMHACARAARLIPYDSAMFVFADEQPKDDNFGERAARVLLAKRLKLYTIWMDPNYQPNQLNDGSSILRTVTRETDGEFLSFYPNIEEINVEAERSNQSLEDDKIWANSEIPSPSAEDRQMRSNYVLHSYTGDAAEQGIKVMDQTLIFRKGGGGHATLGVPVDGGVRDLRLRIEGTLERAALYPPTGPQIDLFNGSSVEQFYPGSILVSNSPLDVLLKLPSRHETDNMYSVIPMNAEPKDRSSQQDGGRGRGALSGVWRLSVRCAECRYRVLVTARATLGFDATLIGDKIIRLRVHGPVATVRETSLVDDEGTEIAKLPFRHQPTAGEEAPSSDDKVEDDLKSTVLVADVPVESLNPNMTIYAQAVGRDIYGESFIRLSGPISSIQDAVDMEIPKGRSATKTIRSAAVVFSGNQRENNADVELIEDNQSDQPVMSRNTNASTFATQILTSSGELLTGVQIGLSTRLYAAPGEIIQLHFEVTNYRDQSVYFRFGATGTLNFLRSISPQWQWVNAGQTVNVIVTAGVTSNAEIGARDTIVFTATGVDQVTLSSYIYVVSSSVVTALDSWPPTMSHTFQGDCLGKQGSDCASNIWSATVTARDQQGGLLRISSSPAGLRYGTGFVSGTREEVTATYRATCCATRVVLSASDVYGNVNAYTVDISGYLTPATIAAITLGVFLIIAIILIVIFLIWYCVRKRQESRELSYPTARRDT